MKNQSLFTRSFLFNGAIVLFLASTILTGCSTEEPVPDATKNKQKSEELTANAKSAASKGAKNFVAPLDGGQEVPSNDSKATGNAIFNLRGDELHFRLIVANIQNVTMVHIHLAPAGVNGPVVVWLYPSGPPPQLIPGRSSGVLATGVITSNDLVGPLAGESLEDLLLKLRMGEAYVNVHTAQFPGGEIRGQIKPAGRKL